MRRACTLALLCAIAALDATNTASATTIGNTGPPRTDAFCSGDHAVWDTTYAFPSGVWNLTSFSYQSFTDTDGHTSQGDSADFFVLRPLDTTASSYTVVGHSGMEALATPSSLETFSNFTPFHAHTGDILGFYVPDPPDGSGKLDFCFEGGDLSNHLGLETTTTDPPPGATVTRDLPVFFDLNEGATADQIGALLDTYSPDHTGATLPAPGPVLADGQQYTITVQGTFSAYPASLMSGNTRGWKVCGAPEAAPTWPSIGRTNGRVGQDAEFVFARPQTNRCDRRRPLPYGYANHPAILFNTGDGFKHVTPDTLAYDPDHVYTYTVTGRGSPLQVAGIDANTTDNYGQLEALVAPASPPSE
jgi:hypothetical protein